ncbi:MAG: rhodanese-like domain-containing protein [Chloroflexi bacterium]|nr:rhodanese-like domain-containing protein [Chloroflexota bacterium]MCI0845955.1 rhodanese-like domain-containing protein [Chloroflexota bacterium]
MARQDPGEPYYRVDSNEANSMRNDEPDNTVVVDVRRDDEWVTGHVTGAIHIPIDDLPGNMDQVPQDKKVLFICAAGVRSGLACEIAASMGYDSENLYNIEDGTPAWIAFNLPTSYGGDP